MNFKKNSDLAIKDKNYNRDKRVTKCFFCTESYKMSPVLLNQAEYMNKYYNATSIKNCDRKVPFYFQNGTFCKTVFYENIL